ncbi:MAG: hypothetical protein JRN39_07140 [Nitrososphaerota archaeon]|nr:hypothetical protein [Nitrososphaerota archaeon]
MVDTKSLSSLDNQIQIRNEGLWECDLSEATIAYTGLTESDEDIEELEKRLTPGCKFVTLALPLVGVIPLEG